MTEDFYLLISIVSFEVVNTQYHTDFIELYT